MDLTKCLNEKEICSKGLAKHYVMPELKLQVHVFKSIAVAYRDKIMKFNARSPKFPDLPVYIFVHVCTQICVYYLNIDIEHRCAPLT